MTRSSWGLIPGVCGEPCFVYAKKKQSISLILFGISCKPAFRRNKLAGSASLREKHGDYVPLRTAPAGAEQRVQCVGNKVTPNDANALTSKMFWENKPSKSCCTIQLSAKSECIPFEIVPHSKDPPFRNSWGIPKHP